MDATMVTRNLEFPAGHLEDLGESKEVAALRLVSFIKLPKTGGHPCSLALAFDKEVAGERCLP